MKGRSKTKITFSRSDEKALHQALRERVARYFAEAKETPLANLAMYLKSVFFVSFLMLAYAALLMNPFGGLWFLFFDFILGMGAALATMNICHDGLHGSYSSHAGFNRSIAFLMDICGKSSFEWGKDHTVDHHTFTNIGGHDHDLNLDNPFLRLCPQAKLKSYHRYQHWYAPFLYCLYPLYPIYKECRASVVMYRNHQMPLWELVLQMVLKVVHLYLFLVLPKQILDLTWIQAVLGYVCYAAGVGVTLAFVFQLAHIVDNVQFPSIAENGKVERTFFEHQLNTTSNFSTHSKLAHFFFGGLNFQVEHHLFPHICHIHWMKLSPIIRSTILEFGLPYHNNPTLFKALKSHFRMLKKFGAQS
jgi:linoleoyl-CoA desaturase